MPQIERRTVHDIAGSIALLRASLQHEEAALAEARTLERLDASTAAVFQRFKSGDYVVRGATRLWWCRDGELLSLVDPNESSSLFDLVRSGVVVQGERR